MNNGPFCSDINQLCVKFGNDNEKNEMSDKYVNKKNLIKKNHKIDKISKKS